jgi:Zn-dependent protease with chaperone function
VIEGRYFDARTSASHPAQVEIGANGILRLVSSVELRQVPLESVSISDRIADIPRRIAFDDGAAFETLANDAIDAALDAAGRGGFSRRLVRWERRWAVALAALLAVAMASWAFVKFGVPALANVAARAMPASIDATIGSEGLELLDKTMLAPSSLPVARQEELRRQLRGMAASANDEHDYRLEFRSGKRIGANAFALPSGIIVVTDELVELAKSDAEIDAVLAHEVGHVRGRHALRLLLQNAGVAALALAVLGDVGSASSLAAAVPVMLVQAKHSRDFEREADAYAREWLRAEGLPETAFDDMLCRLAREDDEITYLSSHPPKDERADCKPARKSPAR